MRKAKPSLPPRKDTLTGLRKSERMIRLPSARAAIERAETPPLSESIARSAIARIEGLRYAFLSRSDQRLTTGEVYSAAALDAMPVMLATMLETATSCRPQDAERLAAKLSRAIKTHVKKFGISN